MQALASAPELRQPAQLGVSSQCKWFANALGRLTVYDAIFVDERGMESLQVRVPKELSYCYAIKLSPEFYAAASEKITMAFNQIAPDMRWLLERSSKSSMWWDYTDKKIFDDWADRFPLAHFGSSLLCDSQNSFARVLFYLELARSSEKTIVLTPRKNWLLHEILSKVPNDTLQQLERTADDLFGSYEQTANGAPSFFEAPVGPLGEYVLSVAKKEHCSPLEAVGIVRNDEDCINFRKLLRQLEGEIRKGRTSTKELQALKKDLQNVATLWHQKTNMKSKALRRKINLTAIPAIGWLFKLINKETMTLRDYDLCRKPSNWYFVAKWYSK